MTRVIFRTFKVDNEVIALFPDEIANEQKECWSYTHYGQHSPADYNGVIRCTKPASDEEAQELLDELRYIGYDDLKVCKRK
jgi:hypothetical protein